MVRSGRGRVWWGIMGGVIWCRLMSAIAAGSFEGVAGCFESIVGFLWDLGYVWRGVVWRLTTYFISALFFFACFRVEKKKLYIRTFFASFFCCLS